MKPIHTVEDRRVKTIRDSNTPVQYHDGEKFNSPATIDNKNIVVIRYDDDADCHLKSMTVGRYYVAEKVNHGGINRYALLTHDRFVRVGTEIIRVNSDARFKEFEIKEWVDINNLHKDSLLLCPIIEYNTTAINLCDGTIFECDKRLQMLTHEKLKSWTNSKYGQIVAGSGIESLPSGKVLTVNKSGTEFSWGENHESCPGIPGISDFGLMGKQESEEDMERRINNTNVEVIRHTVNNNIGINEDYLLIN